ncbi:high mobility group box domain-containing protein, partial [Entophlyctis helioformis]
MSAFLYYLAHVRPVYTAKYPGSTVGPISKMISVAWRALSDDEKQPFLDKANADKERYAREMEEWMRMK